jgi:hypothetical protein
VPIKHVNSKQPIHGHSHTDQSLRASQRVKRAKMMKRLFFFLFVILYYCAYSYGGNALLDSRGVRFLRYNALEPEASDSGKGNVLIASRSHNAGDVLVTVPLSMCLLAHRSGAIR